MVYEHRLTCESAYRAQQNGMSIPSIIAFLSQAAGAALPQNVQRTLEEWGESFRRVVIRRNVSLLHALDPLLLDRLQGDPAAPAFVVGRRLPRVLITRSDPAARESLAQALQALEQLPATGTPLVHDALLLG